jgi:hypothetical protein
MGDATEYVDVTVPCECGEKARLSMPRDVAARWAVAVLVAALEVPVTSLMQLVPEEGEE